MWVGVVWDFVPAIKCKVAEENYFADLFENLNVISRKKPNFFFESSQAHTIHIS